MNKLNFKIFLSILAVLVNIGLIHAQTEQPPTSQDSNNVNYYNDYKVDNIITLTTINLNLNTLLSLDSLELGKSYEITYNWLNPNNFPIVIKSVAPSCTCIFSDWYKTPIAAGATGFIKIKYLASIPDKKSKTVQAMIYDELGLKPLAVQPIKISVNVKYLPTN